MSRQVLFILYFTLLPFLVFSQTKSGVASYYHQKFHGKKTASGDIHDSKKLTAASNLFKLGTIVLVTNIANGQCVEVLINDRMSKNNQRLIDLTHEAAQKIGMIQKGICKVTVKILNPNREDEFKTP